ncbi:MAG: glycosyltransferase family 4 protein [Actinomycetota bacterium]|nr:glycosyltransferase family 4 protein [Actinomycetota bacterium]
MRILACVHEAPAEPLNGFGLQVSEVFDRLATRHEVRMIACEPSYGTALRRDYLQLVPRAPAPAWRWVLGGPRGARELAAALRPHVEAVLGEWQPDVVHVSSGRLAALVGELGGVASVLAALDAWHLNLAAKAALSSPLKRALLSSEQRRVRTFVAAEYPKFDRVAVVSEGDRDALREVAPALDPVVIPNGVDAESFSPGDPSEREPGVVVFSGAMDYAPNESAAAFLARDVMPLVWNRVPDARLRLVGRSPSPTVSSLASERVVVTGEVDAMQPWLRGAAVYACPMVSGTGIKNKLLEALACSAPVVCTSLACRGLTVVPGEHLEVADDAPGLAAAIVGLLTDDAAAARLGAAGRLYVLENHSWDAAAARFEALYEEARRRRMRTGT